jgi:hypothetical protein
LLPSSSTHSRPSGPKASVGGAVLVQREGVHLHALGIEDQHLERVGRCDVDAPVRAEGHGAGLLRDDGAERQRALRVAGRAEDVHLVVAVATDGQPAALQELRLGAREKRRHAQTRDEEQAHG